jgi:hypothetical protein
VAQAHDTENRAGQARVQLLLVPALPVFVVAVRLTAASYPAPNQLPSSINALNVAVCELWADYGRVGCALKDAAFTGLLVVRVVRV